MHLIKRPLRDIYCHLQVPTGVYALLTAGRIQGNASRPYCGAGVVEKGMKIFIPNERSSCPIYQVDFEVNP